MSKKRLKVNLKNKNGLQDPIPKAYPKKIKPSVKVLLWQKLIFIGSLIKSKINKKVVSLFLLFLFSFALFFTFGYKKNGYLNGEVVLVGNTTLSYNSGQVSDSFFTTSPLCGCLFPHPRRGVMFFNKSFDVTSNYLLDSTSGTSFAFISPSQNFYYEPMWNFKVSLYYLSTKLDRAKVSIDSIINNPDNYQINTYENSKFEKRKVVISHVDTITKSLVISTYNNNVHFELYGNYPIASLIPLKNSEISITKAPSNNFFSSIDYSIRESFSRNDTTVSWEFPMIDISGSKIGFFIDPDKMFLDYKSYRNKDIPISKTCLVVLDVTYVARVVINRYHTTVAHYMDSISHFSFDLSEYSSDVTIKPNPLSDEEFRILKERVDRDTFFRNPSNIEGGCPYGGWILPFLSNYNGVYFYGSFLSKLKCEEATGICQYGNKSYHLEPSRAIELQNLDKDFFFYDEPIITPISYDKKSSFTSKFKGKGKLFIDGEFVGETILDNPWVSNLLLVIGIISGLLSILLFIFQGSQKAQK